MGNNQTQPSLLVNVIYLHRLMGAHSVENALMVRVHEAGCFDANIPRNAGPGWANL